MKITGGDEVKRLIIEIILVILIITSSVGGIKSEIAKALDESDGLELFYTVTVEKGKDTAHVDVNIQNLSQSMFKIGFYGVPNEINNYVKNLAADSSGIQARVEYTNKNIWTIFSQNMLSSINIGYDISKVVPYGGGLSYIGRGGEVAVFINDLGGLLMGEYFFLVPMDVSVKSIKVKFNLPADWQIVCPYVDHETYFEVPKITNDLLSNFTRRQGVYFGKMKFYSEKKAGNCIIKFWVLEADQSWDTKIHLSTQEDVDFYAQRTATAVKKLTEMFGDNPYPVISMYTNFRSNGYSYPGTRELAGGNQYWPPDRYDEVIGHLFFSWMREYYFSPVAANDLINLGIGESYLGNKLAYKITGDKHYLGKIYHYYLVYKGAQGTKYASRYEIKDEYFRGCVVGLWLDNLIQRETNGKSSIEDVIGYLYQKYKNTYHEISNSDLEETTDLITKQNNSALYRKYVDGEENIPVDEYMQPYKDSFNEFIKVLNSDNWVADYHNYTIPFFVNVEMAIRSPLHLPTGILIESYYMEFAKYVVENYNIDTITKKDVEDSLSKLTGEGCTGFFERWKDSYGELSLEEMKDWLKSYLPYAPQSKDTTPPEVVIHSPDDNSIIDKNTVIVFGMILDSESGVDKVTVNGNVVSLSYDGSFSTTESLSEGVNKITIIATDKAGNQATKTLSVIYEKPVQTIIIILWIGQTSFTVNGVSNTLDSPPVIKNNRTLLPIRAIIESLGGTVGWDSNEKKVTVTLRSTTLELWIGKNIAKVNGVNTPIDATDSKVVPEIINGRTMLPLRFIAESLGCKVDWELSTQTITILYRGG